MLDNNLRFLSALKFHSCISVYTSNIHARELIRPGILIPKHTFWDDGWHGKERMNCERKIHKTFSSKLSSQSFRAG